MYLEDVINSLKNIKLSLTKLEDTNFKTCVNYLAMTIQILENYRNNPGQIERQLPPNQISGNKKKAQKTLLESHTQTPQPNVEVENTGLEKD